MRTDPGDARQQAAGRLQAWSDDGLHFTRSVRFFEPTYRNPAQIRRDVRLLLVRAQEADDREEVWRQRAFDALELSKTANDNCELLDGRVQEAERALREIDQRFEAYTAKDVRDRFAACAAEMQAIARSVLGGDVRTCRCGRQDGEREADARATLQWLERERIVEGSIEDFAMRCARHVLALVVERDAAERALSEVDQITLVSSCGFCAQVRDVLRESREASSQP